MNRAAALGPPLVVLALVACSPDPGGASPPSNPHVTTTAAATTTSATTTTTTTTAAATTTATATTTAAAATTTGTSRATTTTTIPTTTTLAVPVGPVACPPTGSSIREVRPPSDLPAPELPDGWRREVVGSSVQGRDLVALVRPVDPARRRVLVIGGLHGNEPVSPPTVRGLVEASHTPDVEVWLVPEANPDGVAAGMRCNAAGVDLNRNFPWRWRADDGGPGPLSEPETAALAALVERLRPDVVIWVHQPYGFVSSIGPTASALERAWAGASGVPVRADVTQHGGGESWSAFVAGVPSMLVEIDTWSATPDIVTSHRAGYEAVLDALG